MFSDLGKQFTQYAAAGIQARHQVYVFWRHATQRPRQLNFPAATTACRGHHQHLLHTCNNVRPADLERGERGGTNLEVCGWYPTPIQAARVARPPDSMPLPNSALREFPECAFVREQASENELELGILRSFQWDQLVVSVCFLPPAFSLSRGTSPACRTDTRNVLASCGGVVSNIATNHWREQGSALI